MKALVGCNCQFYGEIVYVYLNEQVLTLKESLEAELLHSALDDVVYFKEDMAKLINIDLIKFMKLI